MDKDPKIYLNDVIFSIELIEKYIENSTIDDFVERLRSTG